jgi:hypothetical protein
MKPICKNKAAVIGLYFISILLIPCLCFPQCLTTPTVPSCNPPGGIPLVNNDVVVTGQTKILNSNASYNSLTMSGGTLIVCSSLTLSSISFASGTLIINPGASVLINSSPAVVFGNNSCIFNFGAFTITSSIVTGQNNIIYNAATSSVFTVAFNQFVIQGPNTYVINNGIINAGYIIVQSANSPGPVCSGPGSFMVCNIMINQYSNAFLSPAGPSCINITQQIINNQPMTLTSSVTVCYLAPSVSIIGSPNFGSATVNSNCPSCMIALPIKFVNFSGHCVKNKVTLQWMTEAEGDILKFIIERSINGIDFLESGSVLPNNLSTQSFNNYTLDINDGSGENYFRIKEVDKNNSFTYSPIIYADCQKENANDVLLYSTLSSDYFSIRSDEDIRAIKIYDIAGRLIRDEIIQTQKTCSIILSEIARGTYVVSIETISGELLNKKLILY